MSVDATGGDEASEVMASIDTAATRPELVIADIAKEDAWISVREEEAPVLTEWC